MATTGHPAASARCSNRVVTAKLSEVYSWNQTGLPRALLTSSIDRVACVENSCRWLRFFAARADATSPSGWKAPWLLTGASTIGELKLSPNSCIAMSIRLTSTKRRARS
jgi:hypothetical protein